MTIANNIQTAAAKSRRKLPAISKTSISKDGQWKTFHERVGDGAPRAWN
jgi:hypothetical protein